MKNNPPFFYNDTNKYIQFKNRLHLKDVCHPTPIDLCITLMALEYMSNNKWDTVDVISLDW